MKWKSKATGTVFNAFDAFVVYSSSTEHVITLFSENQDPEKDRPAVRMKYKDLIESFEKVEQ